MTTSFVAAPGTGPAGARELDASRRLLHVTERELQRLLLDIHDGPVQHMFAALSQLDLLRRTLAAEPSLAAGPELLDRCDRVRRLLEGGLGEVRSFIGTFRPPEFASRSLREIVEALALQHEADTDTHVSIIAAEPLPALALPVKIALFRVLQEALSNAYRHGGAHTVLVRLGARGTGQEARFLLDIEDDGAGFDPALHVGDQHFGLAGMRDRVEMIGGRFRLRSAPGEGTRIGVEAPLA